MTQPNLEVLPELFFGLVGPIGVDLEYVQETLEAELKKVGYKTECIRITELMIHVNVDSEISEESYDEKYHSLIEYADKVCKKAKNAAALAALAVAKIRELREMLTGGTEKPANGYAFIIRQFKRPHEIELMRKTYGRKFLQISVSAPEKQRRNTITNKIIDFDEAVRDKEESEQKAILLVKKDHHESDDPYGQRISKVFHLGDVFVDGLDRKIISNTMERFIEAFFGHNGKSPTIDEYGMYMATAASLRSIDLSRQVGASIFSKEGHIQAMGCNEVPKAFGGTYWESNGEDTKRDFDKGYDANQSKKTRILYDLIDRMGKAGFLSKNIEKNNSVQQQLRTILNDKGIKASKVMDIIEFGRMIHAEMSAITDAARTGISIKLSTMYCTTFPCHMCAKHIVSSGIDRLVYLEPYPKSYASELHSDSITFDKSAAKEKVFFQPFIGISPRRYRDIFEKKARKNKEGKATKWYKGNAAPMLEDTTTAYMVENEDSAIGLIKNLKSSQQE